MGNYPSNQYTEIDVRVFGTDLQNHIGDNPALRVRWTEHRLKT